MTIRSWKHLLLAASLALAGGLVLSVYLLAARPVECPRAKPAAGTASPATGEPVEAAPPAGADYAVIYRRDLLKPLYDPKPEPKVETKPPPPKLRVTLEGTAVEPGFTYGVFRTADGKTRLVSVGETIAEAEVLEIRNGEAVVRHHGREITLEVPEKGDR